MQNMALVTRGTCVLLLIIAVQQCEAVYADTKRVYPDTDGDRGRPVDLYSNESNLAWQLFVLTYRFIDDSMYTADASFDKRYFTFLVTPGRDNHLTREHGRQASAPAPMLDYNKSADYKIVHENQLPVYSDTWQRKTYLSLSMIYHAAVNNLCAPYARACGFIENDIRLRSKRNPFKRITRELDSLAYSESRFIAYLGACHPLSRYVQQDPRAIPGMIADYNDFFEPEVRFSLDMLDKDWTVNSQQSWLADEKTNADILRFLVHVMENGFVKRHAWRGRPSYFMDRYQAIAFLLYSKQYDVKVHPLCLHHTAVGTWKRNKVK